MKKVKFINNNISNLPIELINSIGKYLYINNRINYALTCKYFYSNIIKTIKDLHISYLVDTTASMALYFDDILVEISKINKTFSKKKNTLYSLIEFSDHLYDSFDFDDDEPLYIENPTKLSLYNKEVNYFNNKLKDLKFDDGDDLPEAITDGLYQINNMKINNNVENIIILITDSYPHGFHKPGDSFETGCPCGHDWKQIINELNQKSFKLIFYDLNLRLFLPHTNHNISSLFRTDLCNMISSNIINSYKDMNKYILEQL